MKGFGDYLTRCVRQEWDNCVADSSSPSPSSSFYMDYKGLKSLLSDFVRRRHAMRRLVAHRQGLGYISHVQFSELLGARQDRDTTIDVVDNAHSYFQFTDENSQEALVDVEDALLRLSLTERDEFSARLEAELGKAAAFYSDTILVNLRATILLGNDDGNDNEKNNVRGDGDAEQESDLENIAAELLAAAAFVVVNVITFRQVLIRYDAFRRTYDGIALTEWQLQRSILAPEHPVHALFRHDDIKTLETALLVRMRVRGIPTNELQGKLDALQQILRKTGGTVDRAVGGHIVFRDKILFMVRSFFFFGIQSYGLYLEPKILVMRGRHLKHEIAAVAEWRESSAASDPQDKKGSFSSRLESMEKKNFLPLILNLVSCFLFMMNNYIIEPSSAYYANALGSSDALSGIMIGASAWFALISAVLYSCWTNRTYKAPILFAGFLMMSGNLLYANAYSYKSMNMCLIGRAITGLGAPRVINRRYVADATPFSLRTAASAAFALVTALGAALGPGMAILLDMLEFEFSLPILGPQFFNGMTGPGYFMAFAWFLYTLAILITFEEPVRSGLHELQQREDIDEEARSGKLLDRASGEVTDDASIPCSDLELNSSYSSHAMIQRKPQRVCGCMKHLTRAVLVCMTLIFLKRIALESIIGSTSVVTKNRYGWTIKDVGVLHLVNGIVVIPVSAMAGWLSSHYEDRLLAVWFLVVALTGMMFLVDFSDLSDRGYYMNDTYNKGSVLAVGPVKYVIGSLIAFSGIEACESYVASLMSKVVPSALAVGTFNSGLLATLVGTGGRAAGDLFITMMGLISIRNLLNQLIVPGAGLLLFSIFLIRYNYAVLAV